jgi:fumarate reductase subunit D
MRDGHPAYWAFLVHRLSGVLLALFLPVHFYVLSLAIRDAARLDGFLAWTEMAPVKLAEAGLVVLLAAHLTGGLRLLAIEFAGWGEGRKALLAVTGGLSFAVGLLFLMV